MSSRNVFRAASSVEVKLAVFPQGDGLPRASHAPHADSLASGARPPQGAGARPGSSSLAALDKPAWATGQAAAVERWWPAPRGAAGQIDAAAGSTLTGSRGAEARSIAAGQIAAGQINATGQIGAAGQINAGQINAPADLEQAFEEARARGFEVGMQEGLADAEEQLSEAIEADVAELQAVHRRLVEEIEALARLRRQMMDEAEGQMVSLAMDVGRRLACESLMADTAWVAPLVREAAAALTEADKVTCRLSPALAERLERDSAPLDVAGVGFEISNDLKELEIVVESRFGRVDASFEERLDHLTRAVRDRVGQPPARSQAAWGPAEAVGAQGHAPAAAPAPRFTSAISAGQGLP